VTNKAIVDYLAAPVKQQKPDLNMWWLVYVALGSGAVLGWFSELNVFAEYMPDVTVARVLTSILVGGGSSLIYDIFDKPDVPQPIE
jgi:hypothetical protein